MKILFTMMLYDSSVKNFIEPLCKIKFIEKIFIVRDYPGMPIDKVEYQCPPKWLLKFPILTLFFKQFLMIKITINEKIDYIHGIYLVPHGIIAFICSKITRKKIGISLIAGPAELFITRNFYHNTDLFRYSQDIPNLTLFGKFLRYLLKKCDIITVTGNYTKKTLEKIGINNNKIIILPHTVDESFKPLNIPKDIDLIYIGRLVVEKNLNTIIYAVAEMKKCQINIKMAIIGKGDQKDAIEKLIIELNLENNIKLYGFQPEIISWYNRSKISVIASKREGFPFTVIESLKCGIPVVVSNCGDIRDVVINGYNGFIIDDYKDYRSFAAVISRLITNPLELEKLSKNAPQSVEKINNQEITYLWSGILKKIDMDKI